MFTHNKPFTDRHGITHTAPVFVIDYANLSITANHTLRYLPEHDDYNTKGSDAIYITYRALYWPSEQAQKDGKKPLQLTNGNGTIDIQARLDEQPDNIITACEQHLQTQLESAEA